MKEDLVKRELRKMEGRKTEKIDVLGNNKDQGNEIHTVSVNY